MNAQLKPTTKRALLLGSGSEYGKRIKLEESPEADFSTYDLVKCDIDVRGRKCRDRSEHAV